MDSRQSVAVLTRTIRDLEATLKPNIAEVEPQLREKLEATTSDTSGFIPLSVPNISGTEWELVKECLDSGWVSSAGQFVDQFENEFAQAIGAKYAVSASSGTAALHLALIVQGVERDDEVLMPSISFIAPANAVRYVGAWPTFIDVDPAYLQLDPARLEDFLRDRCEIRGGSVHNRVTGRRVTAILPVHILGTPANLGPIRELAHEFGLRLIEDATESLGASYRGVLLGSHSRTACFSFNGNKLLTTGGGGMLTTDDASLAKRVKYLSTQAKDDPIEFVHGAVGFNYRLTNVQSALGLAQVRRLEEFLDSKRRIAAGYEAALSDLPGIGCMGEPPWGSSAFWLYTISIDPVEFARDSRSTMQLMRARNIDTRPLWQPLHLSPAHRDSHSEDCPNAELAAQRCLSLPCSTGLTSQEQSRVIDAIREIAKRS